VSYKNHPLDENGLNVDVDELEEYFQDFEADDLNFCLFGTSGVHGSYGSLKQLRKDCKKFGFGSDEGIGTITVLIIQPRKVCMIYGNVRVTSFEDIEKLEKLRITSAKAVKEFLK
jgi:hypothetical protein